MLLSSLSLFCLFSCNFVYIQICIFHSLDRMQLLNEWCDTFLCEGVRKGLFPPFLLSPFFLIFSPTLRVPFRSKWLCQKTTKITLFAVKFVYFNNNFFKFLRLNTFIGTLHTLCAESKVTFFAVTVKFSDQIFLDVRPSGIALKFS